MKYELTKETLILPKGVVYRIKALKDIPDIKVKKGDLGGYIQHILNLSQAGDCWVSDKAVVSGKVKLWGNAQVSGSARLSSNEWCWVSGIKIDSGEFVVDQDIKTQQQFEAATEKNDDGA
jgi:hypothetical protein